MEEEVLRYLRYRVIDQNSGDIVIEDLPHLHQSTWSVRALQPGIPGGATLGDFTVPLHHPSSDEFFVALPDYFLLQVGQKIEGYLTETPSSSDTNNTFLDSRHQEPKFTGVITEVTRSLQTNWSISGKDTLWWLDQSQMLSGEVLAAPVTGALPYQAADIIEVLKCTREIVWADDFTNWNGISNIERPSSVDYTRTGGWTFTSADPYLGLPALVDTNTGDDDYVIVAGGDIGGRLSEFAFASVTIWGTVAATAAAGDFATPGIILLSDTTYANGLLVAFALQYNSGTSSFDIIASIWTKIASAYANIASKTVFTGVNSPFSYELTAITTWNAGRWSITALVNGKDSQCTVFTPGGPFTGSFGIRHNATGANAIYVNRVKFDSRTHGFDIEWSPDRFQEGAIFSGSSTINSGFTANSQSHLDMMLLAASYDNAFIRKTAGSGFKSDSIDYGTADQLGNDFSQSIVLEQDVDIIDIDVFSLSELYATDVKFNGVPGSDTGGTGTWGDVGAVGNMILTDTVTDLGPSEAALLLSYAKIVQDRKISPFQAKSVTFVRTAANADKFREMDHISIHVPKLGIFYQKVLVVGYTFSEGRDQQTAYLDQLPDQAVPSFNFVRLHRPIDYISTTFQPR